MSQVNSPLPPVNHDVAFPRMDVMHSLTCSLHTFTIISNQLLRAVQSKLTVFLRTWGGWLPLKPRQSGSENKNEVLKKGEGVRLKRKVEESKGKKSEK